MSKDEEKLLNDYRQLPHEAQLNVLTYTHGAFVGQDTIRRVLAEKIDRLLPELGVSRAPVATIEEGAVSL